MYVLQYDAGQVIALSESVGKLKEHVPEFLLANFADYTPAPPKWQKIGDGLYCTVTAVSTLDEPDLELKFWIGEAECLES